MSKKSIISALLEFNFWKDYPYRKHLNWIIKLTNKTVRSQLKDPLSIPIIIISYNRLSDLEKLVSFLIERKHKNIVIIDNNSTYPPLLEYYETIKDRITIERMDKNMGHLVFWLNQELFDKYSAGYYIVTDSDIIPNNALPDDYISQMINILDKNKNITKVGLALRIDDIPDYFGEKQKVIDWEKQFWQKQVEENLYEAHTDTTFALYAPRYKYLYETFYSAIRIGGNFTSKHGGWYVDSNNQTEEELFYYQSSNESNSWKLNKNGNLDTDMSLYS